MKITKNYEDQGKTIAQRCAYLASVYNIPSDLFLNTDQTGMHLIPTCHSRTWETKGAKQIKIHEHNDKQHIILAVSSAASKKCLHFQEISQMITNISLLKLEEVKLWTCKMEFDFQP